MHLLYKKEDQDFEIFKRRAGFVAPSLHAALEIVHVCEGSIEFGVDRELYHLETGDLGIVFPNQIHFYQEFTGKGGQVEYILADPSLLGSFIQILETNVAKIPVIRDGQVHPDIRYALKTLASGEEAGAYTAAIREAYMQILLGRILPVLALTPRKREEASLVERTVSYIAEHFTEPVTLDSMARDLYVNPFALSRIFSQSFNMNFNRYLNLTRLEYSRHLLEDTEDPVTEICLDAGFGSQRTFNRVFREEYHMTPAEFRKWIRSKTG